MQLKMHPMHVNMQLCLSNRFNAVIAGTENPERALTSAGYSHLPTYWGELPALWAGLFLWNREGRRELPVLWAGRRSPIHRQLTAHHKCGATRLTRPPIPFSLPSAALDGYV